MDDIQLEFPSASEITLDDKVRFLSSAAAYQGTTENVHANETRMSWVFLAGAFVFKLKKPIVRQLLDFSTLVARKKNCLNEVRLNKRLAPDIYLGVVPLTLESSRRLMIDGTGEPVEWLVKMRRLPEERMLDQAIREETVNPAEISRISTLLSDFYKRANRPEISAKKYINTFKDELKEARKILTDRVFWPILEDARPILDHLNFFLDNETEVLTNRYFSGSVIEAHGDLRPEHVCLVQPPVIFDCLEFNEALRTQDPYDEVSYLCLECERLGAIWISKQLMHEFIKNAGNQPDQRLLLFYRAYRAIIRARLALAHLLVPEPRTPEKWKPQTLQYLAIAKEVDLRLFPR